MNKIGWQRAKVKSMKKEQGFTFLDLGNQGQTFTVDKDKP